MCSCIAPSRSWDDNVFCKMSGQQLGLKLGVSAAAGTMAPFNFTQRASSRTAIARQPEELKMDKLDLSTAALPGAGPKDSALKDAQAQAPGSRYSGKMSQAHGTFEPSKAFVRQLASKSEYR